MGADDALLLENSRREESAGERRRIHLVLKMLHLGCFQDIQEATENMYLCCYFTYLFFKFIFLFYLSLMKNCELYNPELYPLRPTLKTAEGNTNTHTSCKLLSPAAYDGM